jgi:hypothetical protein
MRGKVMTQTYSSSFSSAAHRAADSEPSIAILNLLTAHPCLDGLSAPERARAMADLSKLSERLKRVQKLSSSFGQISFNPDLLTFMQSNGVA